ncbi:hypothetical protein ACQCVP_23210 [Rossellomorea vietnamensis]
MPVGADQGAATFYTGEAEGGSSSSSGRGSVPTGTDLATSRFRSLSLLI